MNKYFDTALDEREQLISQLEALQAQGSFDGFSEEEEGFFRNCTLEDLSYYEEEWLPTLVDNEE